MICKQLRILVALATVVGTVTISTPDSNAQEILFNGSEFTVNEVTAFTTRNPSISFSTEGTFVVVWETEDPYSAADGLEGRLLDNSGIPLGGNLALSTYTSSVETSLPRVAATSDGGFVVVWQDGGIQTASGRDGHAAGVFARRFDDAFSPLGPDFLVNSDTAYEQNNPDVAGTPGGGFVVVWQDHNFFGVPLVSRGINARLFDSASTPLGPQFNVDVGTPFASQPYASVTVEGNIAGTWENDGGISSVRAKVLDSAGGTVTPTFLASTYTAAHGVPRVSHLADGGFVIAWRIRDEPLGTGDEIRAQMFDSAGATVGSEFLVTESTPEDEHLQGLAPTPDGGFLAVWRRLFAQHVYARLFESTGQPVGSEFRVDTDTTAPTNVGVAADSVGNFVVTWTGLSYDEIRAQRLCFDVDSDGLCPSDDPCTNADDERNINIKPMVQLKRINADPVPGNDSLKVQGEFVSATTFGSLDPIADGARVVLAANDGTVRVDIAIPGGAFDGTSGWKANGSGTRFQFKDRSGANQGIQQVKIQDRSKKAPNQVKVQFRGKDGTYPVVAGDEPPRATVVIGDGSIGQCGETGLLASNCKFNGSGTTLNCK